jgi:GMP synthase (glutamine-hydrolysing)
VVEVGTTSAAAGDPLFAPLTAPHPAPARAVHFNHDVVSTLPPTAVLLSSTATGVQAFRVGDHVWGVQFHPEVNLATVAEWAADEVSTGAVSRDEAERALLQVAAADPELERTWREFGHRFAEQVRQH